MVTQAPLSRYDRVNAWPYWPVLLALLANLWLLYLTLEETHP